MEISNTNIAEVQQIDSLVVSSTSNASMVESLFASADVTAKRREYTIVGDEVFIPKLYDDAPQWLKDIIDVVVDVSVSSNNAQLVSQLESMLSQLAGTTVPLNTFTQSIIALNLEDARINTIVETLNSNLSYATTSINAQILDVKQTYVSKDEASATIATAISAEIANPTSELGIISSTLGTVQQAIVDTDSARASDYTSLESMIAGGLDDEAASRATAVTYLNTYVGIDVNGTPTGVGTLDTILDNIQSQVDGSITTWFYSYVPTLENIPASLWTTMSDKNIHLGDVFYDKATGYAYRFAFEDIEDTPDLGVIYTWIRITDSDVTKALADAAQAQSTADGKITTHYGTKITVIAEAVGDLLIASDESDKLYRWNGISWVDIQDKVIVANSESITTLSTELTNGSNTWANADSTLQTVINSKIDSDVATVESKFVYGTTIIVNGVYYKSGFGLNTTGSSQIGTTTEGYPLFSSEFWVDASRFKFTNSDKTGSVAPFTIDASGITPEITFNGLVSFSNVTGYTPPDVSGDINANNDVFAQKLGYLNYADMVAKATAGQTIISGGYIGTGLVNANSIVADAISGKTISGGVITGSEITGGSIYGTYIEGAIIRASFIDLTSTATLTNWQQYTPLNYPSAYDNNFAKNNDGTILVDSQGYVRLMGNTAITTPASFYSSDYSSSDSTMPPASIPLYTLPVYAYDDYKTYTTNRTITSTPTFNYPDIGNVTFASMSILSAYNITRYANIRFYHYDDYYEMYVAVTQSSDLQSARGSGWIKKNGVTIYNASSTTAFSYTTTITIAGVPTNITIGCSTYYGVSASVSVIGIPQSTSISSTVSAKYGSPFVLTYAYTNARYHVLKDIPPIQISG